MKKKRKTNALFDIIDRVAPHYRKFQRKIIIKLIESITCKIAQKHRETYPKEYILYIYRYMFKHWKILILIYI